MKICNTARLPVSDSGSVASGSCDTPLTTPHNMVLTVECHNSHKIETFDQGIVVST